MFLCLQLHIPLRLLCGGLLFACNTIMWTSFSKALRHCSSSARATVTTTASNFISSVSSLHPPAPPPHHALVFTFIGSLWIIQSQWKGIHCAAKGFSESISVSCWAVQWAYLFLSRPSWGGKFLERAMQLYGGWASLSLCVACSCFMDPHLRPSHRRAERTSNVASAHRSHDELWPDSHGGT